MNRIFANKTPLSIITAIVIKIKVKEIVSENAVHFYCLLCFDANILAR